MAYRGLLAVAVGVVGLAGVSASALAQDVTAGWTVPRTIDGTPDLQCVWANNSVTPHRAGEISTDDPNFEQGKQTEQSRMTEE